MRLRIIRLAALSLLIGACSSTQDGTPLPCCAAPSPDAPKYLIRGTVVVAGERNFTVVYGTAGETCEATAHVQDIAAGALVVAANEIGGIAGEDGLGPGEVTDGACVFRFHMRDVPEAAEYRFALYEPPQHPTPLTYSLDEMKSNNWTVHFQAVCKGSEGMDPLIELVKREGVPPDEPANC